MVKNLLSVTALLASFAVLCFGHGLQSVLLPARGAEFDYPNLITATMMSAYFFGFILGSFVCPKLIVRVGHIRIFAAGAACASAIMLLHALFPSPLVWILLRVFYGFCLMHLYTVMESWLNRIGDIASRGKVLSVYMIVNFMAMSGGQMLFFVAPVSGFELFSISAILLSLSLLPLMLGQSAQPVHMRAPEAFGVRQLFKVSPLGVMGCLVSGLVGGAYWGLTAIFILRMGFEQGAVAWFMASSLLGGLVAQWPLGSLSDRVNRRWVVAIATVLFALASGILFTMAQQSQPAETFSVGWLALTGALFGAGFHPLYALCIAHANDFVGDEHFVRASAGLLFVQSVGSISGPLLAGLLMYLNGYAMLYGYICVLGGVFLLYTLKRMLGNRQPSDASPFRILTRTGAFVFFMDPRYRRR